MKRTIITLTLTMAIVIVAYGQAIADFLNLESKKKTTMTSNNIEVNAADIIVIKTGDASITMRKNGNITIKGLNIAIEGSGTINIKASGDVLVKGNKIKDN